MATQACTPTLLGHSPAHQRLLDEVALVGNSALTVLVLGETGVGKELVAQALHAASPRAARPLISLNCAALPEHLVESELFGHVRGAFSGAVAERRGKFELAHGGTLFLDEVGELPLAAQAKLLRVLQGGQLQRLGSDRDHMVDVRVVAATNRNLADEVRTGRMRADFYHRLSVYPLWCRRCASAGTTCCCWPGIFWNRTVHDWAWAACGSTPAHKRLCWHMIGRAMCVSWSIWWPAAP